MCRYLWNSAEKKSCHPSTAGMEYTVLIRGVNVVSVWTIFLWNWNIIRNTIFFFLCYSTHDPSIRALNTSCHNNSMSLLLAHIFYTHGTGQVSVSKQMWVQSVLSSRVKHNPFRTALSVGSICLESPQPLELAKIQLELAQPGTLLPGEMLGWFLMKRKVFKGKSLTPSIKKMKVQLTLKSSTVLLLSERSWVLLKAQLNKVAIWEYSWVTPLISASFPAKQRTASVSLELEAGHLLLALIKG